MRHAHLDSEGALTQESIRCAEAVGHLLPKFDIVTTGGDTQTGQTAEYMTGGGSISDPRAGMSPEFQQHKHHVWGFTVPRRRDLLDAIASYKDGVLLTPAARQGRALDELATEMLGALPDEGQGLIVSYGLSIASAMHLRYQPDWPVAYCYGYRLAGDGNIARFE